MTAPDTISALRETEALDRWPELRPFVREVVARYGDRLHAVLLYGSRARGEAREDSDYDVGVVLEGNFDLYDEVGALADLAYDHRLRSGVHFQGRPIEVEQLRHPTRAFTMNVVEDAIALLQ